MNKKQKLIEAIEKERNNFEINGNDTTEHDIAIDYLKKGYTNSDPEDYDILFSVMYDFDCVCGDYDIFD